MHIRNDILFLFNFDKVIAETKESFYELYRIIFIGMSTVKEWFTKFRKGNLHLNDQPHSWKPKELLSLI